MREFLSRRKRIIAILAPTIFGVIYMLICMFNLRQSVWFDESYSAYLTHFDFGKIWQLTAADVHPPLYYFLLKIWAHIFGHTDFAMRFMSVFFGAVAILFAYMWLKYKYGVRAATLGALLLSLSPVLVRYGQEMRMYTMVLAIVFAATFFLQLAIDNGQKRWWVLYAILLAAGMWTHYFVALAWIAHLVYVWLVYGKKLFKQRPVIRTYLLAVGLFLPWLPWAVIQLVLVEGCGFWVETPSLAGIANYWSQALVYREAGEVSGWLLALVGVVSVMIFTLASRYRKQLRMLLCLTLAPLGLALVLSLPPLSSVFIPRYLLFSIASLSMLGGVGLVIHVDALQYKLRRRKKQPPFWRQPHFAALAGGVLLIATSIIGVCSVYAKGNYSFENHNINTAKELYESIVVADAGRETPIIANTVWLYYDLSFYDTENTFFLDSSADYSEYGSLQPLQQSYFGRIDNLDAFLQKHDSIWYVGVTPEDGSEIALPHDGYIATDILNLNFRPDSSYYQAIRFVRQ